MLPIRDAVAAILKENETAAIALSRGWLNMSAFANDIRSEVEKRCKKPVQRATIVVNLSRIKTELDTKTPLLPEIHLRDLSVKANLVALTYDNTEKTLQNLAKLYSESRFKPQDYLSITQGVGEVSILVEEQNVKQVLRIYKKRKPKDRMDNLVSVTMRVGPEYIHTPNTFYALTRKFALRGVNIIDIISTYTEMSFIVEQKEMQHTFDTLSSYFKG